MDFGHEGCVDEARRFEELIAVVLVSKKDQEEGERLLLGEVGILRMKHIADGVMLQDE